MSDEGQKEREIIQSFLDNKISREEYERRIAELWREDPFLAAERERREAIPEPTPSERIQRFRSRSRAHDAASRKSDGLCFYCGAEDARHLEHQFPVSRGGITSAENCVVSCHRCNGRKSSRSAEEFRIHLMLVDQRPPVAFYAEPPKTERDWLIVGSARIAAPFQKPYGQRLAEHAGEVVS